MTTADMQVPLQRLRRLDQDLLVPCIEEMRERDSQIAEIVDAVERVERCFDG
jgi:hypothetical protein